MIQIRSIILVFCFSIIIPNAFSQELRDGTITNTDFYNEILKNFSDENAMPFDTASPELDVTLPISVYLIRDSNGNEILNKKIIEQSIIDVSNCFKPCGIRFTMSNFEIIGDYNYSYIVNRKFSAELIKKHKQNGVINLFLVDQILNDSIPVNGFTFYPTDSMQNYVFMTKSVFHENNLTTQLGHFFGLLSTHEKRNTPGLADNSDCSVTGDLICDTWADPDLLNNVNEKCNYTGFALDKKTQYYTPSVANFMSNSLAKCKCMFTIQQYRRMQYYYKQYRERCFNKM